MNDVVANPFGSSIAPPARAGGGAGTDQQRAVAEVQAAMMIARMNPRDQIAAVDRILNACTRPTLANAGLYCYSRGGEDVTGPSIRLAEAIAQGWGNLQFGIRELDQNSDGSSVQAFAWDVETNTRREVTFFVPHTRYTRNGSKKLTDPRDIYEMVANQGSRRMRACILAVIPGDVVEAAVDQCDKTMTQTADTSPEAIQKMIDTLAQYGVTREQIEKRIQRRCDAIRPAQIVSLRKIYASLRDGMSSPADWFEMTEPSAAQEGAKQAGRTDAIKDRVRAAKKEPEQVTQPETASGLTYAQVAEQLNKAADLDLLDAAADLIGEVADPGQRSELSELYKTRRAAMAG